MNPLPPNPAFYNKRLSRETVFAISKLYLAIMFFCIVIGVFIGRAQDLQSPLARVFIGLKLGFLGVSTHYVLCRVRNGPPSLTWADFPPWWFHLCGAPFMIALSLFLIRHNGVVGMQGGWTTTKLPEPVTVIMTAIAAVLFIGGLALLGGSNVFVLFAVDRLLSRVLRTFGIRKE
jgi:hypothetical protein